MPILVLLQIWKITVHVCLFIYNIIYICLLFIMRILHSHKHLHMCVHLKSLNVVCCYHAIDPTGECVHKYVWTSWGKYATVTFLSKWQIHPHLLVPQLRFLVIHDTNTHLICNSLSVTDVAQQQCLKHLMKAFKFYHVVSNLSFLRNNVWWKNNFFSDGVSVSQTIDQRNWRVMNRSSHSG